MKKETIVRINAYTKLLPKAKEKVFMSAMLMIIATVVAITVTFAWVTLSRAPVIKGVETVLVSNGSLEIGMSKPSGEAPDEFDVDEVVGFSTDVLQTNLQWGNIINLADSRYGIENIALRPSELSTVSLKTRPLKAADYGADGRITGQGDEYTYFKYDVGENRLMTSPDRGVRAIAHFTSEQTQLNSTALEYNGVRSNVSAAHQAVNTQYKDRVMTKDNINGLQSLMTVYAQTRLDGGSDDVSVNNDLGNLSNLYYQFYRAMELESEALIKLANAQQYAYAKQHSDENTTVSYTELTWADIVSKQNKFDAKGSQHVANPTMPEDAVTLTGLKSFIADYDIARGHSALLDYYYYQRSENGASYTWNDIDGSSSSRITFQPPLRDESGAFLKDASGKYVLSENSITCGKDVVTSLCKPSSVTVDGKTITELKNSISQNPFSAIGLLRGKLAVVMKEGILPRFEQVAVDINYRMNASISMKLKYVISITVNGDPVVTGASGPSYFANDYSKMPEELVTTLKKADDTFGLAIDFWVRTNADAGYLTLEGETKGITTAVRSTGFDGDGNSVELYTITDKSGASLDESGQAATYDVYKKDNAYYYSGSNTQVPGAVLGSQTPIAKYENDVTVTGYEGSNRVWEENPLLTADSTTQGNGSCYIYYADTPEDYARSLDLLDSMRVAFIEEGLDNSDSRLLAIGSMDTDNAYALNGRVTVPLIIDGTDPQNSENQYIKENADGSTTTGFYIAPLYQDIPQQITALIYLDGTDLTNDNVLATEEIQGQLNIQFGSSKPLNTMGDERLEAAERHVSATVSKTEMNYDTAETAADLTTTVTVTVDGESPSSVTAFFVRAINAQQGKRQREMTFTKQSNGVYTANYTFTGPGTYYLRYIRLNGVDYALSEPCKVEVTGFEVEMLTWGAAGSHNTVYTAGSSYDIPLTVSFQSQNTNKQPNTVEARFIRSDGNAVSVTMAKSGTQWKGTGHFTASGDYSLDYLVINGDYYALKRVSEDGVPLTDFTKSLSLHLGMSTEVFNDGAGTNEEFDPNAFNQNDELYNKPVYVKIYDNAGNELKGLLDGKLKYSKNRSPSDTIDTDLTWDADRQVYTGTLPIAAVGRYSFLALQIGNDTITSCKDAPNYVITPPNPPRYDTASQSAYHNDRQFVLPNGLNAVMGPFTITDAETAGIRATVHNEVTGEDYPITQNMNGTPAPGEIWYSNATKTWTINLPTYTVGEGENAVERQKGTWTLTELQLWDVYDADIEFHDENNPLVWNAKSGYNFSKLSTTVSDTIKVTMEPGSTEVGGESIPFYTAQNLMDPAAFVTVTDEDGNPIVGIDGLGDSMKVTEIKYTLNYTGNDDLAYGYKVDSNAQPTSTAYFGNYADGKWTLTTNPTTPYVGEYTVKDLTVTIRKGTSDHTLTSTGNAGLFAGIPTECYTVTAAAPTAEDNLSVGELSAYTTEYGKDANGAITGQFLQEYSITPALTVDVVVDKTSKVKAEHVSVEGLTVQMKLNHVAGTESTYGHYTYESANSGGNTAAMETIEFNLTKTSGNNFSATKQLKLAGEYTAELTIGIGSDKTTYRSTDSPATLSAAGMSNLKGVKVWSMQPTVSLSLYKDTPSSVTYNATMGDNSIYVDKADTFPATNTVGDSNADGNVDYAVVYMQYEVGQNGSCAGSCSGSDYPEDKMNGKPITTNSGNYANYTAPKVTMELSNGGSIAANLVVSAANNLIYSFNGDSSVTHDIGMVISGTEGGYSHVYRTNEGIFIIRTKEHDCAISYPTEKQQLIGTQTVSAVTSTVNGVTFTRTLSEPITLIQEAAKNECPITWTAPEGLDVTVKVDGTPISSGSSVGKLKRVTVTLTPSNTAEYYNPVMTKPSGVTNWSAVEGSDTSTYSFTVGYESVQMYMGISAYPALTWGTNGETTVSVKAGTAAINSGKRIVPGTSVTVTVERSGEAYYNPRLIAPAGVSDWNVTSETATKAIYTFTMPEQAVSMVAPTVQNTPTLSWTGDKVNVSVSGITNGGYVIPGTKVTAILDAGSNGTAPRLSGVEGATCPTPEAERETKTVLTWTFTMPAENVEMKGICTKDTVLNLVGAIDEAKINFTIKVDGTFEKQNGDGVKEGQSVEVTLTAKDGYYNPKIVKPASLNGCAWNETLGSGTYYTTATYVFTMGDEDVNLNVQLQECPTVTYSGTDETITVKNGTATVATGSKVFPNTSLTVTAKANQNYYNPTLSAPGTSLNGSDSAKYFTETTRTFTVGTENINITGSATLKPTVTYSTPDSFKSLSAKSLSTTVPSGSYVMPDTTLTFTATPGDDYYFPTSNYEPITKNKGDGTLTKTSVAYGNATYTYVVGKGNTTIGTNRATTNPTVTYNSGFDMASAALSGGKSYNFTSDKNNVKVRPDSKVTLTLTATTNYYWPTATADGVTLEEKTVESQSDYEKGTYTFTMGTADVELTGGAAQNPTLTVVAESSLRGGTTFNKKNGYVTISIGGAENKVTCNTNDVTQTFSVRPGTEIKYVDCVEYYTSGGFVKKTSSRTGKVRVSGGTLNTGFDTFEMPTFGVTITGQKQ